MSQAYGVAFQANGDFILVGESFFLGSPGDTAIARYLPDGTLDPTFGDAGMVVSPLLDGFNFGENVVVQPNGQIVVVRAGNLGSQLAFDVAFFVARYNPDGTLDDSFGTGGVAITFTSTPKPGRGATGRRRDCYRLHRAPNTVARYIQRHARPRLWYGWHGDAVTRGNQRDKPVR